MAGETIKSSKFEVLSSKTNLREKAMDKGHKYQIVITRSIANAFLGLLVLSAFIAAPAQHAFASVVGQASPSALAGTWTGTSTCVGDRPACNNETVVYRFVPVQGKPKQVRMLGDKIIDGKRLVMGALVFEYEAQKGELTCDFTRGQTHAVWSFTVKGESMTGKLELLPEHSIGRDVKVHRVKESEVPQAPAISEYDQ